MSAGLAFSLGLGLGLMAGGIAVYALLRYIADKWR